MGLNVTFHNFLPCCVSSSSSDGHMFCVCVQDGGDHAVAAAESGCPGADCRGHCGHREGLQGKPPPLYSSSFSAHHPSTASLRVCDIRHPPGSSTNTSCAHPTPPSSLLSLPPCLLLRINSQRKCRNSMMVPKQRVSHRRLSRSRTPGPAGILTAAQQKRIKTKPDPFWSA